MIHKNRATGSLTAIATVVLPGVILLAAGCRGRTPSGPPSTVAEVATSAVQTQQVVLTKELSGRTFPYLVAEIRPQASGIIRKRLFSEGAEVQAGDVLYEIDSSTYEAACAQAEAALAAAQANLVTAKATVAAAKAGRATALAGRDAAAAALAAAKANRSRAEANATPLRLRAQRFSQLVSSKAVSQQDYDDVAAALQQAEAGIESAAAAVQAAEADIGRAVAAIQAAEAEIQRAEAAVTAAEAAVASGEANLKTARITLGYTRITAPISGRIGRSAVTTGALVTTHQPIALARIQQLDPIYVDVPQATADLLRLQRRLADGRLAPNGTGDSVTLVLQDGTPYAHEGTLKFRDITVEPGTGSVILRMVFPNPERTLLPGMFVRAVVEEGVNTQAILVAQEAVARDPAGNPFVMVVGAGERAQTRPLVLDRAIGAQWLVTSGLAVGERVIVEGLQRIRDGSAVREVTPGAGGTSPAPTGNDAAPSAQPN